MFEETKSSPTRDRAMDWPRRVHGPARKQLEGRSLPPL